MYSFATLDVFTATPFSCNPLAIVEVPAEYPLKQEQKQKIASEFNLSETVFLHEAEPHTYERKIDIFTPTAELPFAGHPTIGTVCHVLGKQRTPMGEKLSTTLLMKAGNIPATFDPHTRCAEAEVPHNFHVHKRWITQGEVKDVQPNLKSWQDRLDPTFPVVSIVKGMTFALIKLPSLDTLQELDAGAGRLLPKLDQEWASGFVGSYFYMVQANGPEGTITLQTRMIEPTVGEDPATGSAACSLASFLALQAGGSHKVFTYSIKQGVEMGRRSLIGVTISLDASGKSVEKVVLSGTAVPVMQGTLAA